MKNQWRNTLPVLDIHWMIWRFIGVGTKKMGGGGGGGQVLCSIYLQHVGLQCDLWPLTPKLGHLY